MLCYVLLELIPSRIDRKEYEYDIQDLLHLYVGTGSSNKPTIRILY